VDLLVVLAILAILAVVVWVVGAPLRAGEAVVESGDAAELEELEAEKAAKYREIRDAELDHRTGKLDDADFRAVDRQLRAEAVAILREIDRRGGSDAPPDR
jgi:Na+-transporting methylmalonyl-CoA/oxaloacetate decarboxylase gamma subunit